MMGGDGPNSYAQNSEYQKQLLVSAEDLIHDLIHEHLDTENPTFNNSNSTIRIADFGCSVGPNAFFAVDNIISAVEDKYKSNQNHPEFQVFFNDLIDNDFNTLFRNLPTSRKYFASGSPGSFYGRLFPKATLHFAHCSTALHWLSRIPVEVTEKNSIAWNKGRVHYSGAGKEVKEAYSSQYKEDFETFLSARADELVDGGLMVLVILGFPDGALLCESSIGLTFDMLGSCFQEMAKMGKISEEKVDSFNLPFYYPSPSELKAMIEANGLFNIVRIAKLASPMRAKPDPQILTSHLKAVIGVLVEEHFGNGMMIEELFRLQFEKMVESPVLFDGKLWKEANYFVFLKRNARSGSPQQKFQKSKRKTKSSHIMR
ncbi:hypothetical protein DH2020_015965 [Rehmannia glutinosa]|uniref:S-adenosylmethionine-dependent methyltransferase n=1 Tax=Rehmannia glutinosa TaxID=99300 RepID=A0ABR0WU54_REHGL